LRRKGGLEVEIAIVYYSYSGNTHKAAKMIEKILIQDNSVARIRIEAPKESHNFLLQALRALTRRKIEIARAETDLSSYDLIIFGSPVWAREVPPAMRSYLDKVRGLIRKNAVVFVTYGSGFGKELCLDSLEHSLQERGVSRIGRFSLEQFRASDRFLIERLLGAAMDEARACPPSAPQNAGKAGASEDEEESLK